jgi:hypothetical protein
MWKMYYTEMYLLSVNGLSGTWLTKLRVSVFCPPAFEELYYTELV